MVDEVRVEAVDSVVTAVEKHANNFEVRCLFPYTSSYLYPCIDLFLPPYTRQQQNQSKN